MFAAFQRFAIFHTAVTFQTGYYNIVWESDKILLKGKDTS